MPRFGETVYARIRSALFDKEESLMDVNFFVTRLTHGARVIEALVQNVPREQSRWRPAPGKWSILEVVNHLYDEERLDFRARLEMTLKDPKEPWPPIDPPGWVIQHKYNDGELKDALSLFLHEREMSIEWLSGLSDPDWHASHKHPQLGEITAGSLLASWAAHDLLHVRQIARVQWEYTAVRGQPHDVDYAGNW